MLRTIGAGTGCKSTQRIKRSTLKGLEAHSRRSARRPGGTPEKETERGTPAWCPALKIAPAAPPARYLSVPRGESAPLSLELFGQNEMRDRKVKTLEGLLGAFLLEPGRFLARPCDDEQLVRGEGS